MQEWRIITAKKDMKHP